MLGDDSKIAFREDFDQTLNADLLSRKADHLYRQRRIAETAQQVEMRLDGHNLVTFCSNDYLGLANHPALKQAAIDGIDKWGVGGGAAHLVNGHSSAHESLEEELATFTGYERALLFSTGYMANLGISAALSSSADLLFQDKLNHASLIDAGKLSGAKFSRYLHCDPVSLEKKLLKKNDQQNCLVMTDSVFSMDGNIAPLTEIAGLCRQHNALLAIDDAHGFGVLGASGSGSREHLGLSTNHVPVMMGTLGKAAGVSGAFVAGSKAIIETLIQKARTYIYTTATPPAMAEATRVSLQMIQQEAWRRDKLQENILRLKTAAKKYGWQLMHSDTAIQPLLIGDAARAIEISAQLYDKGLLVPAIRPPTVPQNTSRLRITLSAEHKKEHIDRLVGVLTSLIH